MSIMKIRDSHAEIKGCKTTFTSESGGIHIIGEDGKSIFEITLMDTGEIEIRAGQFCRHKGILLDTGIFVIPQSSNVVQIKRAQYVEAPKK